MSGLVGVIAQETARYSMFSASLTSLDLPKGTIIKWWWGHSIADNCNALVREMYEQEKDWLWLLGDDHTFSPQTLNRLNDWEKDIIVPLCVMRAPPYLPVLFSGFSDDPDHPAYARERLDLDDYPQAGVVPVHSAGSAGMLIRRSVFDALEDPWFEAAVLDGQQLGEDLYFCDKARAQGFEIYADLDTKMGHCLTAVAWPVQTSEGWTFGFTMMGGFEIVMPPGTRT